MRNHEYPVLASFGTVFLVLFGCDYGQGMKQVRTTADLQTICGKIETTKRRNSISEVEGIMTNAVRSVNNGRDAWGNPYAWKVRQKADGASYVVLSMGSDARLDVPAIDDYFEKAGVVVLRSADHKRDIVFRDGDAVITGGK